MASQIKKIKLKLWDERWWNCHYKKNPIMCDCLVHTLVSAIPNSAQ